MKTAYAILSVTAVALALSGQTFASSQDGTASPRQATGALMLAQSTGGNQGTDRPGPGGGPISTGRDAQGNYGSQSTGGNQGTDRPGPGGGPISTGRDAQGNTGCQSTGGNAC